jgi:hypothetical protein
MHLWQELLLLHSQQLDPIVVAAMKARLLHALAFLNLPWMVPEVLASALILILLPPQWQQLWMPKSLHSPDPNSCCFYGEERRSS